MLLFFIFCFAFNCLIGLIPRKPVLSFLKIFLVFCCSQKFSGSVWLLFLYNNFMFLLLNWTSLHLNAGYVRRKKYLEDPFVLDFYRHPWKPVYRCESVSVCVCDLESGTCSHNVVAGQRRHADKYDHSQTFTHIHTGKIIVIIIVILLIGIIVIHFNLYDYMEEENLSSLSVFQRLLSFCRFLL